MLDLHAISSAAIAEARLARRLVRTWIIGFLAVVLPTLFVAYYAFLFALVSPYSASVGALSPDIFAPQQSFWIVAMLCLACVFLGFDVRARDERERVAEVLDSRPIGTLELLAGRYLGLLLVALVPALVAMVAIWFVSLLADAPASLWALSSTLFAQVVPGLAFVLALTFFVSIVVRVRLVAAVVVIALVAGLFVAIFRAKLAMAPLFDLTGAFIAPWPSSVAYEWADPGFFAQRLGVLLLGFGLLIAAAALHRRSDQRPRALLGGAAGAIVVFGALGIGYALSSQFALPQRLDAAREHHAAWLNRPLPTLERVEGSVRLEPGDELALDLELTLRAPGDEALDALPLALNPGYEIEEVLVDGNAAGFSFEHGLLVVDASLSAGGSALVTLRAAGEPDADFGYLDEATRIWSERLVEAQRVQLGTEPGIFSAAHVALMPTLAWLPRPGPELARDDGRLRVPDPFELSLVVDAPENLGVALVGSGERLEGDRPGRQRRLFAPRAPVRDVALVAGEFVERSVEAADVRFSVWLSPGRASKLETLAPMAEALEEWLEEHFSGAAARGLTYPYEELLFVEVPHSLRAFGGGWRMRSVLAPAGLVLMRENGLPGVRIGSRFDDGENFAEQEGGVGGAMLAGLLRCARNDFSGGNPFLLLGEQVASETTGFEGPDAPALEYVFERVATQELTGESGFFSAHAFDSDFQALIGRVLVRFFSRGQPVDGLDREVMDVVVSRPEVWDAVLGTALGELDPDADPKRALDALQLKGSALALTLRDQLGAGDAARLTGALIEGHAGEAITRADVEEKAAALGLEVASLFETWLDETALAGVRIAGREVRRLPDNELGGRQHQVLVRVVNEEPAPAFVTMSVARQDEGSRQSWGGKPVLLPARSAIEIGLVTGDPPQRAIVDPYLSLNRDAVVVPLPAVDENAPLLDAEPFRGARDIPMPQLDEGAIVVDDLDPGFSVKNPESSGVLSRLRLGGRGLEGEADAGLPEHLEVSQPGPRFSRLNTPGAWGRYRRTSALIEAGSGEGWARFEASLPESGRYRLEVHKPDNELASVVLRSLPLGRWPLRLEAGGELMERTRVDASAAPAGWIEVGTFSLPAGEVAVVLGDEVEGGRLLYADAVRFVPLGEVHSGSAGQESP